MLFSLCLELINSVTMLPTLLTMNLGLQHHYKLLVWTYNGNFEHEDQEIGLQNMLIISHSKQIFKNIEVTQNSHRNNPSAKVARRNSNAVSASFNRQS